MKIREINDWLSLIANLGVLVGLVFLVLELNHNSKLAEREIAILKADSLHGTFVTSDFLSEAITKVTAVQGTPGVVTAYMKTYDMTEQEAYRYWRYLLVGWLYEEAEWIYRGRNTEACEIGLLRFLDQQILFENMQQSFDPEFISCINKWYKK